MTEEQPKITNVQKEKDPRRVAAGKKLGAISKMAKNRKLESIAERCESEVEEQSEQSESTSKSYKDFIFECLVGLTVGAG